MGRIAGPLSQIPGKRSRNPADAPAFTGWRQGSVRDQQLSPAGKPHQLERVPPTNACGRKAFASGLFIYASTDAGSSVSREEPRSSLTVTGWLRSQGVDLTQAGQDLSTMLGGDYVNRFSIQGQNFTR